MKRRLFPNRLVLLGLTATALAPRARATSNGLAQTPLMGWTSWSNFGKSISETTIKAQADAMASQLASVGYAYINLDAGWRDYSHWDAYGRETWDTSKFPNGIPALASYIHGKGLKIGIYLHPGMDLGTNSPYELNTPIEGTAYHAQDITDTSQWGNTGQSAYRIDFSKPGAAEYIQGYANLLASWGIDYIKFDFVGPGGGTVAADDRVEMEHWNAALQATGRPIWIELSNSLSFSYASEWKADANGWRIDGDIESGASGTLSTWTAVAKRFTDAPTWAPFAGPGGWNDFDALPLGNGSHDGITTTERQTTMTLWAVGCAPLILGADLTTLDSGDRALITNTEVIAVNQAGRIATPVSQSSSQQVWRVQNADGSYTVALFNLGSSTATVTAHFSDLGFSGFGEVRDLFSHIELGTFNGSFGASLASHASRLLKVTPTTTLSYEAETLSYVTSGASASVQTDANSSAGKWLELAADGTGDYLELTLPSIPAATYQIEMEWKGNNNRGKLSFKVDGSQLGSTLDQYSASESYPTTPFGTLTFSSATTHKIRLTVTGKDSTSKGYGLSADRIILVRQ